MPRLIHNNFINVDWLTGPSLTFSQPIMLDVRVSYGW
jgi:hypothetical protein